MEPPLLPIPTAPANPTPGQAAPQIPFPRYAWGRLDGVLFQARLINCSAGEYKAWPISEQEAPPDPETLLRRENWGPHV